MEDFIYLFRVEVNNWTTHMLSEQLTNWSIG